MFIAALLIITENWKQSKCLLTGEWLNCGASVPQTTTQQEKGMTYWHAWQPSGTRNSIVPHTKGDTLPGAVCMLFWKRPDYRDRKQIAVCLEVGGEDWLQRAQGNSRLMEIVCILIRTVVTGLYSFVKPQRTILLNAVCTLISLTLQKTLGSWMFPSHWHGHESRRGSYSLHFSLCLFSVFPSILRWPVGGTFVSVKWHHCSFSLASSIFQLLSGHGQGCCFFAITSALCFAWCFLWEQHGSTSWVSGTWRPLDISCCKGAISSCSRQRPSSSRGTAWSPTRRWWLLWRLSCWYGIVLLSRLLFVFLAWLS